MDSFSLANKASFNSLDAALAATDSKFDMVKLQDNVDLNGASLTVSTGAALDLNGLQPECQGEYHQRQPGG